LIASELERLTYELMQSREDNAKLHRDNTILVETIDVRDQALRNFE